MSIFEVALESFIDMNHELVLLSQQIDWPAVESEFAEYYCADNGRPSVPIRRMVGMMLLKSIYNLSDEGVVARWMENPYMQYFTGEKVFQKCPPMNPADLTKFRNRRCGKDLQTEPDGECGGDHEEGDAPGDDRQYRRRTSRSRQMRSCTGRSLRRC